MHKEETQTIELHDESGGLRRDRTVSRACVGECPRMNLQRHVSAYDTVRSFLAITSKLPNQWRSASPRQVVFVNEFIVPNSQKNNAPRHTDIKTSTDTLLTK